ncbi:hypothetical protein CMZ84_14650 [Lysobacteraceae bacterium NML93-0399]|nr:hypothetical protein CMZ84_14650 [Xanthomonadaceae bacterium NML93-0399]
MEPGQHSAEPAHRPRARAVTAPTHGRSGRQVLAAGAVWLGCAAVASRLGAVPVPPWLWSVLVAAVAATAAGAALWSRRRRASMSAKELVAETAAASGELRELMRLLPDGVMLLIDTRIVYANPACETLFDCDLDALTDAPVDRLVDAGRRSAFLGVLRVQDAAAGPASVSQSMQRSDGTIFQAALSAAQTRYDGRPCTLLLIRDLTDAERMRDRLAAGNRELHALAARVFTVQEDERRAISRELHDDIGQSVTAMKMAASAALDEADVQRRRDDLEDIQVLADTTLEKLRDISILLRPPQLDALGLEAALRWHAERILRNAGIEAALEIEPLPARPEPGVEQACFRIAQEALTNVMRHAGARHVRLRLRHCGAALSLEVCDDGRGFPTGAARGLGLVIMRERAHASGGTFDLETEPGDGTRIRASWPQADSGPALSAAATAGG